MKEIELHTARLDGYLTAARAFCGRIREFAGSAFLLRDTDVDQSLEEMLRSFFLPHATYIFTSNEELTGGLGELETDIRQHLVCDLLGLSDKVIDTQSISDRRKYLSFRIMDMVGEVLSKPLTGVPVFRLKGGVSLDDISSVFYCIRIDSGYLVMHFIDDAKRLNLSRR